MPQPNEAGPGQLDTLDMGIVSLEEIARRGVDSDASSSDTSVEVEDQWQQLRAHRGTSNAKRTTGARHKAARHRRAAMRDPTARAGFAVSDGSLWSARSGRGGQVVSAVVGGEGAAGGGEAANASGGGEGTPTHPSGKPVVHFPVRSFLVFELSTRAGAVHACHFNFTVALLLSFVRTGGREELPSTYPCANTAS